MICRDCRNYINAWQETCPKCGADVNRKGYKDTKKQHPAWVYTPTLLR